MKPFVQCYWTIRADARTLPTPEHGVIPGGYVDLVFNVGDSIRISDSGGIFAGKERSFFMGPFDRFRRFRSEGRLEFFGVRFHLGRASFLSNLPLRETRNRAVPLDAFWEEKCPRAALHDLEHRITQAPETQQRIICVEQFLLKFLQHRKAPDATVTQALSLIQESKGQISVKRLASALRISDRQLERKFMQHIGLSPKTLCRVTRFRQVKSLLESTRDSNGCELAYTCGYYDQTHLISEFRLFTGQSPTCYESVRHVGFFLYDFHPDC